MRATTRHKILKAISAQSIAYRTYLIRFNAFSCTWWIEKDGQNISSASSQEDAKRTIDMLTGAAAS